MSVDFKEVAKKAKRRGYTGACELKFVDETSHQPLLINCGKQAKFYKPEEVGMFGSFICDSCFERKYLNE